MALAGRVGDHNSHRVLDEICHAAHEYALGQRPLFGKIVSLDLAHQERQIRALPPVM
jgi:hypothetical protein